MKLITLGFLFAAAAMAQVGSFGGLNSGGITQIPNNGGSGGGGVQYSGQSATYTNAGGPYYFPAGGGAPASTTRTAIQTYQAAPGTISVFGATFSPALGAGVSAVMTWYDG